MPYADNERVKFFNIVSTSGDVAEIHVYGDIVDVDVWEEIFGEDIGNTSRLEFLRDLDSLKGKSNILVRINSPGGDVSAMYSMYTKLRTLGPKITTLIEGIAASAASILFLAGDERYVVNHSVLMAHETSTQYHGRITAESASSVINSLTAMNTSLATVYAEKSIYTLEECQAMMKRTTWMLADEMMENGFATHKVDESFSIKDMENKVYRPNSMLSYVAAVSPLDKIPGNVLDVIKSQPNCNLSWYDKSNSDATNCIKNEEGGITVPEELDKVDAVVTEPTNKVVASPEPTNQSNVQAAFEAGIELTTTKTALENSTKELEELKAKSITLEASNTELANQITELTSQVAALGDDAKFVGQVKQGYVDSIIERTVAVAGNVGFDAESDAYREFLMSRDVTFLAEKAGQVKAAVTKKFEGAGHGNSVAQTMDQTELEGDTDKVVVDALQSDSTNTYDADPHRSKAVDSIRSFMVENNITNLIEGTRAFSADMKRKSALKGK